MKILVFLALLSTSFFSQAEDNGNSLLDNCQVSVDFFNGKADGKLWMAHSCSEYINGLVDLNALYPVKKGKGGKFFCPPQDVTHVQIVRVVLKSLKDHPEHLHERKFLLVILALEEAFPCKV
jgi:hypothetical protein